MSWIHDNCDDGNWPYDLVHAQGLLKLHESCDPPCPRKTAALVWLDRRGIRIDGTH